MAECLPFNPSPILDKMTTERPILVWIRRDCRLSDHPALYHACKSGQLVIPFYIWDPISELPWKPGSASKSWLHHSLRSFQKQLNKRGSRLLIRKGDSLTEIRRLIRETSATDVVWNRSHEPSSIARYTILKQSLLTAGTKACSFQGNTLIEPWDFSNKSGRPFQVFTPFWKQHRSVYQHTSPLPEPKIIRSIASHRALPSVDLDSLGLEPEVGWDKQFYKRFQPGEEGAKSSLNRFIKEQILSYSTDRNMPSIRGTSRLSPHLHFGEISPRQVFDEIINSTDPGSGPGTFLTELGWREFAIHLLYHFPHSTQAPLKAIFGNFPWQENPEALEKWKKGQTGIPIIDAGMRELWETGWMHNRVRMIAASYLVKNLMIPWQKGAEWFWDTLVDADLASNSLGWQWVAGSGADAAPYFRIFNPVLQSKRFDPQGDYIREWVPELTPLSSKQIHTPWEYPNVLAKTEYPEKQISLIASRDRALRAYELMKGALP